MYAVYHCYDVDGGFGDAISKSEIIAIFQTKELANTYATRWNDPHIYSKPYDKLVCGLLEVRELGPMLSEKDLDRPPMDISPVVDWAFNPNSDWYENNGDAFDDDEDED